MSYRTDTEPVYKAGFRTEIEERRSGFFRNYALVQRHIDSPHNIVWTSEMLFPSADSARRRYMEMRAAEAVKAGKHPASVCANLTSIAFSIHWAKVYMPQSDHPSVALEECEKCVREARRLVLHAAEELDWIKEVSP